MDIILSLLIGAVLGAGGMLYWQRKKPQIGETLVKPNGGGGPGEEKRDE